MSFKKSPEDTKQIVVRAKDDLARYLREVMDSPGKTAEELARDIREAAEFIAGQLRVEPTNPPEVIGLTARRSLAVQVTDLLSGDESPEEKVGKARSLIEKCIIKTEAEILSNLQNRDDDRLAEMLAKQEAGEKLSLGELTYVKARQDGHGEYVADLLAWQAVAPNALHPDEAAFLEAKLMGHSDEAANHIAKLALESVKKAISTKGGRVAKRN